MGAAVCGGPEQLSGGLSSVIRSLASNIPILAVSPWMSARSRELLARDGVRPR
jgi:hypothetical protein